MRNIDLINQSYETLLLEINSDFYTNEEKSIIKNEFLYYGRYINPKKRNYFKKTVFPVIDQCLDLFKLNSNKTILDIGCGLGMQSLIFAQYGASVIAVDIDNNAIKLAKKRKVFFERILGKSLNIDFIQNNFGSSNSKFQKNSIDYVFSMSAFSYIQPMNKSISLLNYLCKKHTKVLLYEENKKSIYGFLRKFKDIPTYKEFEIEFRKYGFNSTSICGTCSIPSVFWNNRYHRLINQLNLLLNRVTYLSFSYSITLERS